MTTDPLMKFLFVLAMIGLASGAVYSFLWRPAVRRGKIGRDLPSRLWENYLEGCRWLLRHRWLLVLLGFGAIVSHIDRSLLLGFVRGDWRTFLVGFPPGASDSLGNVFRHFARWATYLIEPLRYIPVMIAPFDVAGGFNLTGPMLVLGLWGFRRYAIIRGYPERYCSSVDFFTNSLKWITWIACSIVVCLVIYSLARRDAQPVWQYDSLAWWIAHAALTPFWVLATTACSALLASALLGSLRAHLKGENAESIHLLAFRNYRALYILYLCLALLVYAIQGCQFLAQRFIKLPYPWFTGFIADSYLLLQAFVTLALLFAPAAVVCEDVTWPAAIRRSLRLWRSQPWPILVAVAFFTILAFVLQSVLTLTLGLFGQNWILTAVLRQWIQLLFQATVLLGVLIFYVRVLAGDHAPAAQP